jgi:16S rRNA (cytosine967-C5)-methyltransferase
MINLRKLVYNSLISLTENEKYANIEADTVLKRNDLTPNEKGFFTAFFYGVTERQITIDYQIKKLSSTPIEKLQTKVLVLLRMGIYQILFMDSVPDHAAVNETVSLAKELVNKGAVGYINGILRAVARELKSSEGVIRLITPSREKDVCGYLSITYSYPRYLCKLWVNAYGEANAEKIMKSQNSRNVTTIRVNTLKYTHANYLEKLRTSAIKAVASENTNDGIHLTYGAPITSLPDFENGAFFVQDDSSRLCVEALNPQEGENVLDACACPGGKSFASAIAMKNVGSITSCDLHYSKLSLIESGAKRLGIRIITPMQADSSVFKPEWKEKYDKVLCDVPCSGFGTISKKPDLRLKDSESVKTLPDLQLSIVNNCAKYVKKGGILVYSTCTLNPAENEENILKFLNMNKEFTLISQTTKFPFEGVLDGFFFAKLKRI